ncbi:hypothetical protein PINS_up002815 [Pythium insidiosum]|nr:hypothetical protein PINS_up002815 [Pythium insidiosum]
MSHNRSLSASTGAGGIDASASARASSAACVDRPTPPPLRLLPRIVDAHCHFHDDRVAPHRDAIARRAALCNVTHVATCACHEADWEALDAMLEAAGSQPTGVKVIPAFGIHPWWAATVTPQYLSSLRSRLLARSDALLGEIGLCKSARGKLVDLSTQQDVFRAQLRLAAEMRRVCVIHCVGAYGMLLEILQAERMAKDHGLPPVLILHSFGGPADMIAPFLALERTPKRQPMAATAKVFFSFNAKQLSSRRGQATPSKAAACCAMVPLDTLLLETDAPDQGVDHAEVAELEHERDDDALRGMCPDGLNEPATVHLALRKAAAIRQMPVEDLADVVWKNCEKAFGVRVDARDG